MLVYLMGVADIFAAIMLVTGIRPSLILLFTMSMLLIKGIASFFGRFNLPLHFLGAIDILAIILLLQGGLGQMGIFVLIVMVFKGFISFWSLKILRDIVLNICFTVYKLIKFGTLNKSEWMERAANYLWFGSGKIKDGRLVLYEENYPKRTPSYPFLRSLSA